MRERGEGFKPEADPLQKKVDKELENRGVDRRGFLKSMGLLGAAAATAEIAKALHPLVETKKPAKLSKNPETHHKPAPIEQKPADQLQGKEKTVEAHKYAMGILAGRHFGDLYTGYTGIEGLVPVVATINFPERIKALAERKQSYADRHKYTNTVFKTASKRLVQEYETKDHQISSLADYGGKINDALEEVSKHLNWDKVASTLGLKESRLDLLRQISESLQARDLLAYSLTELMPSKDGQLNKHVLDFLLRNAGERYVYSIPAVGDAMTSFGPYQFTSYALYDTGHERRGVSIVNQALPKEYQLPGSVINLRGDQHHKAAYLFIIDNLGNLIKHLKPSEFETLSSQWISHKPEIIKFIAAAHHAPAPAITAAEHWLSAKMTEPFEQYCTKSDLQDYAKKTQANLEALTQ